MSRHNQLRLFQNFTNATMGVGTITSSITSLQFLDDVGLQWNWTGSPVGNFQVQVSVDYDPNTSNPGTWTPLVFTYFTTVWTTNKNITTAQGSPYYVDLPLLSCPWLRVQYIGVSGSGVLNGFLTAKGF